MSSRDYPKPLTNCASAQAILLGTKHIRTIAYHPQTNGMVERFHHQMKSAIKCHDINNWYDILPIVLLGIYTAIKADLNTTSAQLVHGTNVRLPAEFFLSRNHDANSDFLIMRHGLNKSFIFKEMFSTPYMFVRHDAVKSSTRSPCNGPYKVIQRDEKSFSIDIRGKLLRVSIDRLKPAFIIPENIEEQVDEEYIVDGSPPNVDRPPLNEVEGT
ncbi:uncharacterized protein LOC143184814 [Calliopsis andreniformis]|uniref:uncharacterized protein LOC143184814 n=1 Tax=Calliopsis andreniformis TaxID=337506 RepID=UPI003FCE4B33